MERLRSHLGISCIVLGVVLIVVAALLDPGGTVAGAVVKETAAVALTVVIYLVLRRQTRRSKLGTTPCRGSRSFVAYLWGGYA